MEDRAHSRGGVGRSLLSGSANESDRRVSHASAGADLGAAASEGTAGSIRQHVVGRAHALLGVARTETNSENGEGRGRVKRVRKERGPNWSLREVKALIEAKRFVHRREQSIADARELMMPDTGKWQKISELVMAAGVSQCPRDGIACKSKWNQLIPEYKRIADYFKRSGSDDASFWHLSIARRREERLPRSFAQDIFWSIHEWYGQSPAMLPAHGRDLLQPEDTSFKATHTSDDDMQGIDGSHEGSEIEGLHVYGDDESDSLTASTQSPSSLFGKHAARRAQQDSLPSRSASPHPQRKSCLPAGVTPQLISSSDTGSPAASDRPANTGVRRKSMSGHTLIAEATKLTGNALTNQMREAAEVSRDIEKSKMDLQLRQFNEQMLFQRERDQHSSENAKLANANARLSIIKQGEVVQALSTMTSVLSAAFLQRPAQPLQHSMHLSDHNLQDGESHDPPRRKTVEDEENPAS